VAIVEYLLEAEREYDDSRGHEYVDAGDEAGEALDVTIDRAGLTWTNGFIAGDETFEQGYVKHVQQTKAIMRADVYGTRL
jgi:hypothetical protein